MFFVILFQFNVICSVIFLCLLNTFNNLSFNLFCVFYSYITNYKYLLLAFIHLEPIQNIVGLFFLWFVHFLKRLVLSMCKKCLLWGFIHYYFNFFRLFILKNVMLYLLLIVKRISKREFYSCLSKKSFFGMFKRD